MMALVTSVFINLFLSQAMILPTQVNWKEFTEEAERIEMNDIKDTSNRTSNSNLRSTGYSFQQKNPDGETIDEIVVSLVNTIGRWRTQLQRSVRAKNLTQKDSIRADVPRGSSLRPQPNVMDELFGTSVGGPSLLTSINTMPDIHS